MKIVPTLLSFIADPMIGVKSKAEYKELINNINKFVPEYRTVVLIGSVFGDESDIKRLKDIKHKVIVVTNDDAMNIVNTKIQDNPRRIVCNELQFMYEGKLYSITPTIRKKIGNGINIHGSTRVYDSASHYNVNAYRCNNMPVDLLMIDAGEFR